ncbi:hypothetical protein [Xanthomonas phage X1]|nr:hypothetical protein [Xanthomonas phage X1]
MCDEMETQTVSDSSDKLALYNPTPFQREWMERKQEEADFKYWLHTRSKPKRVEGKLVLAYMTEDGLRAVHLGRTEVLAETK